MKINWKYRVHCARAEELQELLNHAGEEGYEILHLNHRFLEGPEAEGVCFVVLGRRQESAEPVAAVRGHGRGAL